MINALPPIQASKWKKYTFETNHKYYMVILQQNLFHEWSVTNIFGSKKDKQGKMIVTYCDSYKDALEKIAAIKKVRKARKYVLKKAKKLPLYFRKD